MGVSVGSSMYNAPSIYESGAGGGGGGGGSGGAGVVPFPEGYKRILYFSNDGSTNKFYCRINNIEVTEESEIEIIAKFPNFPTSGSDTATLILSSNHINHFLRDWTSHVGKTWFNQLRFFSDTYQGSSIIDLRNDIFNVKINKEGYFINGNKIISFTGIYQGVENWIQCPSGFGGNPAANLIEYLYSLIIKKNDNVLNDLLPAIEIDTGKIGFIDIISENFYQCSNAIAGPEVPY